MRIGAHQSIAGGLNNAVDRAVLIGANALQIFTSPPQQWLTPRFSSETLHAFKHYAKEKHIDPILIHACYLINLASDSSYIVKRSIDSLIADLEVSEAIDGLGVVLHLGSHKDKWNGSKRLELINTCTYILEHAPQRSTILIENSAGSGGKIPSTLEEMAQIKKDLPTSQIKFCIDTAHAFAAGYDLRTPDTVKLFADAVEYTIGWKEVRAIHLNDSKIDLGNKNDRHENIGEGKIGLEGLSAFITSPFITNIPMFLETPGFNHNGPDQENVERVKRVIHNTKKN